MGIQFFGEFLSAHPEWQDLVRTSVDQTRKMLQRMIGPHVKVGKGMELCSGGELADGIDHCLLYPECLKVRTRSGFLSG